MRRGRLLTAVLVPALAGLVVAAFVASRISTEIPFDSDEANHANLALRQYQDLAGGHLADFVRHSYRTGQFPFLHGWMVVPWFALLGPTVYAARVAQCALLVLGCVATAWAAFRAADDDPRAGAVAGCLFAFSPLLAAYSGLCMLEVPGAATTAIALAVFAEACRRSGRAAVAWHVATAAAVLAVYFTKLNYGLWIAPAIGAGYAVRALDPAERRAALRGAAVYLATLLVVAAVWYSTEAQRAAFAGFLHNPAERVPAERDDPTFRLPGLLPGNFLAYFGLVASGFHVHAAVGAAVLALFAWGARPSRLRIPVVAASVACVAWTWLVLSMGFREYALARFVATALPPLWIVAGAGAAALLARLPRGRPAIGLGLGAAAAGLALLFARVPAELRAEYEVGPEFEPFFAHVAETLEAPASVLVVNYTDHTSARTLAWRLATRDGATYRDFDVKGVNSERIFESSRYLDDWMAKDRRWGGPGWRSYLVEVVPGPRYPDRAIVQAETVELWSAAIARHSDRLERVDERRFEDLDFTVVLWRDLRPPEHLGLR